MPNPPRPPGDSSERGRCSALPGRPPRARFGDAPDLAPPAKLGGGGDRTFSAAGDSISPIDLPVTAKVPEFMLLSTCSPTKQSL